MARWRAIAQVASLTGLVACSSTLQRIDPEASEKRFLLGADYFAKGALRPALEELLKAVELNPRNAEAHNMLGIVFLRQASDVEERSNRLTCLGEAEVKLERGEIEGKLRTAREQFLQATRLRESYSDAWNNLAVVELQFKHWDQAIEAANRALTNITYPEAWAAQGNLGWAYYQKGDLLRAAKELRTAVFTNPRFCVGRYRLAKIHYEQQNFEAAARELEWIAKDSACPIQEAFYLKGLVELRIGGKEARARAAEAFRRCVELAPQSCLAKECRIVP